MKTRRLVLGTEGNVVLGPHLLLHLGKDGGKFLVGAGDEELSSGFTCQSLQHRVAGDALAQGVGEIVPAPPAVLSAGRSWLGQAAIRLAAGMQ